MIVTISGQIGSGKSTIAKALAKKLGLKHYSAGDFMREMAKERGVSLLELGRIAEQKDSVDKEIDRRTVELGKKEDNFIIDSRLAFHFIPNSIKVFLKVDPDTGAQRVFRDLVKGLRAEEMENTTLEKTKRGIAEREESERVRYLHYYSIDFSKETNYNLIVDTTSKTPEQILHEIIGFIKKVCV